jgi:hypothetical protein
LRKALGVLLVLLSAGIVLSVYFGAYRTAPPPHTPLPSTAGDVQAPAAAAEAPRYVLEQEKQATPLPALNASDGAMKAALRALWRHGPFELFRFDGFIRRVVATVDNLPRRELAERLRPAAPAPGHFRTAGNADGMVVSPQNFARYSQYMELVKAADPATLVAAYVKFYPLFQQAYEELGYPNGYFNDRLIEVIDHLVAAPQLPVDARLRQPKIFYQFAEDDLEQRSAGEKILMRVGNENAAVIKAKLRAIRAELVRRSRAQ